MSSIGDFRLDICPTLSAPIGNDLLLYTLACASENTPEATVTCYTVEGPYYDCKTITEAPITHDPNYICKSSCFRTRMADPNDRRGVFEISSIDAVSTTISAVSSRIISASSIIAVTSAASSTISFAVSSIISSAASSTISADVSSATSVTTSSISVLVFSTLPPYAATATNTTSDAATLYPSFIITFAAIFFMIMSFKRSH